jgi:hypothetical protein
MFHKKLFLGVLLIAGIQMLPAAAPDPVLVPTPRARLVAATPTSRPFLAAARSQLVVDLAVRGYAEKEVLVRGAGARPWVTRVLVRRPTDATRFSGRVIVELLDASGQYDSAPLWSFSWEHLLRRGDAWVGVTISPASAAALSKFNAARYGTLDLAAGAVQDCGRAGQPGQTAGDVIAQVGALLRSSSKENPLLGLNPQRLIAAGYAAGADDLTRFAVAPHRDLRLGDGAPIFDGYVSVAGTAAASAACAAGLPRDVPFIHVAGESAVIAAQQGNDAQAETQRVYQVPGAAGAKPLPAGAPVAADLAGAGIVVSPDAACREPVMDQTFAYALNAIWQQLDELLVLKRPMISLPQVGAVAEGSSGGWRLPQVDLPLVAVSARTPRTCNAVTGSLARLDAATLKQRYRSRVEYLRQFNAAVDQAVTDRLLVAEDAAALKSTALRTTPTF